MVFDFRIFDYILQKQKSANKKQSGLIKIACKLYKNSTFCFVLNVFEKIIAFILLLPIPVYKSVVLSVIKNLPGLPDYFGTYIRSVYYAEQIGIMGKNILIDEGVKFVEPQHIIIGDNTIIDKNVVLIAGKPQPAEGWRVIKKDVANEGEIQIGQNVHISINCVLSGMGGLKIGDNTAIGAGVVIHSYSNLSNNPGVRIEKSVSIGNDVIIGSNSTIICSGDIESGTLIKPNSFIQGKIL